MLTQTVTDPLHGVVSLKVATPRTPGVAHAACNTVLHTARKTVPSFLRTHSGTYRKAVRDRVLGETMKIMTDQRMQEQMAKVSRQLHRGLISRADWRRTMDDIIEQRLSAMAGDVK